jgi:hypothetical protein
MRINERKRGARYFFLIDFQSVSEAFDEHSLARAQWSIQQNDVAAGELVAGALAERESFAL